MAYFLDPTLAQLVRDEQKGRSHPRAASTARSASPVGGSTGGGRRNKFAAPCIKCGRRVPAGEGSLDKVNGAWVTAHLPSCP